jgi:hypothetical protein
MPRIDSYKWKEYENKTLVHYHMMAKIYKKRYQRSADFQNTLYRFFGLITVVSSTIASTLAWGMNSNNDDINDGSTEDTISNNKELIVSTITTISAVAAAIQNFYKFQENANNNITTAKAYAKLQNKIEIVGNIHPEYRESNPTEFLKKINDKFDQISDTRTELSNFLTNNLYSKKSDSDTYLEDKHLQYLKDKDEDKHEYSKHTISDIHVQVETDTEDEDHQR